MEIIKKDLSGELTTLKAGDNVENTLRSILTDWYNIKYVVKMGNDSVNVMSPGKKALVLLQLLIDLDETDCPILIDQPEDDLDNRSIFEQLIPFIKKKKAVRQIIVVTHNANIVVGADAEEVIIANQNGADSPNKDSIQFFYRSGSIENDGPLLKETGVVEDGILAKQSAETSEKLDVLNYMRNQANDMKCLLNEEGFNIKFAEMLHDGWQKKKSIINSISNNDIDSYYNLALEAGASGGKLLGAGGGGFILVYCDEQYQKAVREAVGLYELNFRIARYGSRVVYFA